MTRTRWLLLSAATTLVLATSAAAQPVGFGQSRSSRPIRLMLAGGANIPIGDLADEYDPGVALQGSVLLHFAGFPINLRTDINYSQLRLKDLFTTAPPTSYGDDVATLLGGLVSLTLPLGNGPVRPYVMAGLGAFNVDPAQRTATAAESSVEFAINGGAGLQLRLFGLEAFIEARVNSVYTDRGIIDTKGIRMVPVTFGVIF